MDEDAGAGGSGRPGAAAIATAIALVGATAAVILLIRKAGKRI
jgi:hypothetical protein